MTESRPSVSVLMISYNHEKYIRQAVDSVLSQKTDFPYEIVIGEDCSTDGTRQILLEYRERYPDKIKLILHTPNVGAMRNQVLALNACKGKYIAVLEGDDYWTDENKLQKQIDFMESAPDVLLCGHNGDQLEPDGILSNEIKAKKWYSFEDFAAYGCPVKTMSIVFRNIDEFKRCFEQDWIYNLSGGDQLIFFTATKNNKVHILEDNMGVYRKQPGGSWAMIANRKRLDALYNDIRLYKENLDLNFKQRMYLNWKLKGVLVGYLYENNPKSKKFYWPKRVFHIFI